MVSGRSLGPACGAGAPRHERPRGRGDAGDGTARTDRGDRERTRPGRRVCRRAAGRVCASVGSSRCRPTCRLPLPHPPEEGSGSAARGVEARWARPGSGIASPSLVPAKPADVAGLERKLVALGEVAAVEYVGPVFGDERLRLLLDGGPSGPAQPQRELRHRGRGGARLREAGHHHHRHPLVFPKQARAAGGGWRLDRGGAGRRRCGRRSRAEGTPSGDGGARADGARGARALDPHDGGSDGSGLRVGLRPGAAAGVVGAVRVP